MLSGTNAGGRLHAPNDDARRVRSRWAAPGSPRRSAPRSLRSGAALLAALPLAVAAAQAPLRTVAPLPASAAHYRQDLALLVGRVSDAAAERRAQVAFAAEELARARWGFEVALEASPEADYRLDLLRGTAGWDLGFGVELELGAALDRDRVLRAEAALAAAESRVRTQLRADLRAGLLALSEERLDRRSLADAETAAVNAEAEWAAARAEGVTGPEAMSLEVEATLAAVALEREQLGYRPRAAVLADLGVTGSAAGWEGLLQGPLPDGMARSPIHAEAAALRYDAARAELAVSSLPFAHLREVEVAASYRSSGVLLGAEVGLRAGVPTADAQLAWRSGDAAHRFDFGVSATLLFSDASSRRASLAAEGRERSLLAMAAFEAAQPGRERGAERLLELAYEELYVLLVARDNAFSELENARAEGRASARLETGARRSEDAAERAWQRYVRALHDYLTTVDAVIGAL